jgi:hypothetical protein
MARILQVEAIVGMKITNTTRFSDQNKNKVSLVLSPNCETKQTKIKM